MLKHLGAIFVLGALVTGRPSRADNLLTEQQMCRLWGLDAATCAVIIAALVGSGILCETPKHGYALSATSKISRF